MSLLHGKSFLKKYKYKKNPSQNSKQVMSQQSMKTEMDLEKEEAKEQKEKEEDKENLYIIYIYGFLVYVLIQNDYISQLRISVYT